jgi:hypothetical protein
MKAEDASAARPARTRDLGPRMMNGVEESSMGESFFVLDDGRDRHRRRHAAPVARDDQFGIQ